MRKIYLFGVTQPEKEEPIHIKCAPDGDGIIIRVVDSEGNPKVSGLVARITPEGKLIRYRSVDKSLGLSLDADGRIALSGE